MTGLLTLPEPGLMVPRSDEATTVYPYQRALDQAVRQAIADILLKAPIASPTFTGDPKAPTPSPGDNDTSIATTAFVTGGIATAIAGISTIVKATDTPSGNTSTFTSIPAAKLFFVVFSNVSHNSGGAQTMRIAQSTNNGSSYSTPVVVTSSVAGGANFTFVTMIARVDAGNNTLITFGNAGAIGAVDTGVSGAVNALQASWSGSANFDAGDVSVYSI